MTRRREVGTVTSFVIAAALTVGLALPAQAQKKLELSGTAALTTDYIFRGISQTSQNPAAQAGVTATYGIFYIGAWGSNVDFGAVDNAFGNPKNISSIEIDYYAGIAPTWKGFTFDIAALYYTYPGAFDPGGELDYFELKTAVSYTFAEKLTATVANYWSPEFGGETGNADAIDLTLTYAFGNKLFNFFSPSISGLVGYQDVEFLPSYTYWNAGLTLGFMENWSVDVRYWDTNLSTAECGGPNCDARVVGTLTASF